MYPDSPVRSTAGPEPSREECRPYIEREREECESRAAGTSDTSSAGPLGWLSDILFAESRYMRQRDLAIAARERDLVRVKVSPHRRLGDIGADASRGIRNWQTL